MKNRTVESRDDDDIPLFLIEDHSPSPPPRNKHLRPRRFAMKKMRISTTRLKEAFGMFHFCSLHRHHKPDHSGLHYREHRITFDEEEDCDSSSASHVFDLSIQTSGSIDNWISFSEDGFSHDEIMFTQFNAHDKLSDVSASPESSEFPPEFSPTEDYDLNDCRTTYSI